MDRRELLILEPAAEPADRGPRFSRLQDYWALLVKQGITSVRGRPTVSRRHCYGLLLAQLVLDQVDFEFDEHNRVPSDLPDDLGRYRNVLIYAEDFERHAARLARDFPDAAAYHARQARRAHPTDFTPSRDGERRLYIRPLAQLITGSQRGPLYWSMRLTMGAEGFRSRQLARPDRQVWDQALARFLAAVEDPNWDRLYPPCKCGPLLGREWTEVSCLQQLICLELGDLLDEPRLRRIAEQSIRRYLAEVDWQEVPDRSDRWALVAPVAYLYEKTGEAELLEFLRLRLRQREQAWGSWRGCYGNWPDPPDQWLRDSSLLCMVACAVAAAAKLDDADGIDRQAVFRQAVHQALLTEHLLRDPATGWYRFGADGRGMITPSFATHSSYWHLFALTMLLAHLPEETPGRDQVVGVYRRLAEALARGQDEQGMWPMHLDRPDPGMGDAGYTAAITGSLLRGLTLGLLDPQQFEPVARRGLDGVKLRSFDGYLAGGVVGCQLSPSPRYFYSRTPWEELNAGTWQHLFLLTEALRWQSAELLAPQR